MNGEYHDFALMIRLDSPERVKEWETILRAAEPEPDMSVAIRKPTLLVFGVKADIEFLAIDRATGWLNGLAERCDPPLKLSFNAQPSHEV